MRTLLTAAGFMLVIVFFLGTEHRAHLFGLLPYALLLACPLLHFFMHGSHSGHERKSPRDSAGSPGREGHGGYRS